MLVNREVPRYIFKVISQIIKQLIDLLEIKSTLHIFPAVQFSVCLHHVAEVPHGQLEEGGGLDGGEGGLLQLLLRTPGHSGCLHEARYIGGKSLAMLTCLPQNVQLIFPSIVCQVVMVIGTAHGPWAEANYRSKTPIAN